MKGLGRLAAFFVLVAFMLTAVNWGINFGLRHVTTSSFGVTNKIVQGAINAEILVSGSSRALTHYDPEIIQHATGLAAYNIGLNGSQTDMQLARLRTYLAHNQKPTLLIQNLDLFSFEISHDIYDPAQYLPYLKEPPIYQGVHRVYPDAWKWKYLPLYGYAVEDMRFNWFVGFKALFGIQPAQDHFAGYRPNNTPWTGDFEKFRANNPKGVTIPLEEQGARDFEELLATCARFSIPVILVYSPEYFEMQAIERNRSQIMEKAREIANRFSFPLWDYSGSSICRDRQNFYNSQHLNRKGATAFSTDLALRLAKDKTVAQVKAKRGGD